jgi:hypothetical protein
LADNIIEYNVQIQQQLMGANDTLAKSDLKALNEYESWRWLCSITAKVAFLGELTTR